MKCESCNHTNLFGYKFCVNCGKVFSLHSSYQSVDVISLNVNCNKCGRSISAELLFCTNCGEILNSIESVGEKSLSKVSISWDLSQKRTQASSEIINTPPGVVITVKRSRTLERLISIDWNTGGSIGLDVGVKQIITASIRSEIKRAQGSSYKHSETVEYEVQLSGSACNRYVLSWTDIWSVGHVIIKQGVFSHTLPFQYRESTELEVVPVTKTTDIDQGAIPP